jgi:Tol biopolymer transport system component
VVGERRAPPGPGYFAWSPDGSTVLYWADGVDVADEELGCYLEATFCGQRIWSAAADGGDSAQVIGDPEYDACSPTWTPDGESIVFVGSAAGSGLDIGFYQMDADGSGVERIGDLAGGGCSDAPPAISPDGTTLAVTIDNGTTDDIYLVDLAAGDDSLIASGDESKFGPFWSPDGSLLAYTTMHPTSRDALQRVMLYDVASGETISLGEPGEAVSWSPDGRYIATWLDGVLGVLDVSDPTAPVAIEIEGATEADGPSWQPRP